MLNVHESTPKKIVRFVTSSRVFLKHRCPRIVVVVDLENPVCFRQSLEICTYIARETALVLLGLCLIIDLFE